MSVTLTKPRSSGVLFAAGLCAGMAVLGGVWLARERIVREPSAIGSPAGSEPAKTAENQEAAPRRPENTVVLSEEKIRAIGVRLEKARVERLHADVVVSGMFEYDTNRKVNIQSRVPGIVRTVSVGLGSRVKTGQPLIVLDSPDAGTARLEVQRRLRDLANARFAAEWRSAVAANVGELLKELAKGTSAPKIEQIFAGKDLGSNRSALLSAYADWEIARHEEEVADKLVVAKIYGEHKALYATHTREGLQAKYEGLREQARFDAQQQKLLADQQVKNAEASLLDARQRLRLLGVPGDPDTIDLEKIGGTELAAYSILAPFDGTIVMRAAVESQRVEPIDALFTLVDLSKIRVVANIPESDIAVLSNLNERSVRVTAKALPDRVFEAKVLDVSKEVDQKTRTVRLLAEIDNREGTLRANMFARVRLEGPKLPASLTVPVSAIVEIDGKTGVFVPGKEARSFSFHPILVGDEAEGRRIVEGGLRKNAVVVSAGGFMLKSELILQNEPEED